MYLDLIKSELNEAAQVLEAFIMMKIHQAN